MASRKGRPHFAFNQPAGKQHGEPMEFDTIHCHLLSLNKVVHKARQQCYHSYLCFRAGWNSPLAVNRLRAKGTQAFGIWAVREPAVRDPSNAGALARLIW